MNEVEPERPGHDLQLAALPRARRLARAAPPQARADEPRAADLGPGRRARAARGRDRLRPARRADLLGELHAARALRALRVGRRDLHRVDRRRRRRVAGDARPHRPREPRVRRLAVPLPARVRRIRTTSRSAPRSTGVDVIGRGGSAILAPDGSYLAGPLYDEEQILYAELDPARVLEERQRFDPVGHYHRPDVLGLTLNVPSSGSSRAADARTSRRPSARSGRP